MRVRSATAPRLLAPITTVLVLLSLTPALSGSPGVAAPVLITGLLLAVLASALATARARRPLVDAVVSWRHARCEAHALVRQCDPDAAGHVRPRAPGVRFALTVS